MTPLLRTLRLNLERPHSQDKRADRERLFHAIQAELGRDIPVEVDLGLLRELPRLLREGDFGLTLSVCTLPDRTRVVSLGREARYAAAIDIGTTNMVASLIDCATASRVCQAERENPQILAGVDVLTRVQAAMMGEGERLHRLLVEGVNSLISDLCRAAAISPDDVFALSIAGNTIMTHFLLALPVENIPVEPYLPVSHGFGFLRPEELGLEINPSGLCYVFPNAGSYVGGDIISGILAAGLHRSDAPSLLIDVGTNAEIALGCRDWIMVGAGAAGPALEGGISGIGMRAQEGAVYRVEQENRRLRLFTIGDREPRGVCGSGMISLMACLFDSGIIDGQGRLSDKAPGVREEERERERVFVLNESPAGRLLLRQKEIENFLRSKAAMFASLLVTVSSVGLGFREIERFFVSGALGTGIDPEKAVSLGMLPDVERERLVPLGNSSLRGAEMLLLDDNLLGEIDVITRLITYREMNTDGEFMREFPAALFIPHTNPEVLRT